ncbi:MAG TPA: sugar dehydrogenase [Myxococcaceae bacterium]|nr:sugar dehydrogenase [Myxococcaceae bacterium]
MRLLTLVALGLSGGCNDSSGNGPDRGGSISRNDGGVPAGGLTDGGDDGGAPDGGVQDGGSLDGGAPDAGAIDGGAEDGGVPDTGAPDGGASIGPIPPASVDVPVRVPASMRGPPFDVPRTLRVPPGFSISVHARIPGARFMAVTPEGALLVSYPYPGTVYLVRPGVGGSDPVVSPWVTGLKNPHDLVFHRIGSTQWLYVAESNAVRRYVWTGASTAPASELVVSGLPDRSTPELHGAYAHALKNIALDSQHRLFVSIASTCNVCTSDVQADPMRAAIHLYDATGGNHRLYARGLRNAEGLDFFPGTDVLWGTVNARDEIPYPFQDSTGWYGRVIPQYVDNHPPDSFTPLRDNGDYGWPFCNPNPDGPGGPFQMPLDRDYDTNRNGAAADCARMDRAMLGFQAHSAPLGLLFLQATAFPSPWKWSAAIALHGSWNRRMPTGAKVILVPFTRGDQRPSAPLDLVTGWIGADQQYWGRPVDVAVDGDGAMFISDDHADAVYRLIRSP